MFTSSCKATFVIWTFICCAVLGMMSCGQRKATPDKAPEDKTTAGADAYLSCQLPDGFVGKFKSNNYIVFSDSVQKHDRHNVSTIKSIQPQGPEFATVLTYLKPEKSIGKRIRYTALVRSEKVKGWAGLWMRIDPTDRSSKEILGFDNMHDRPVTGTTDWTKYEIVLDVPEGAAEIVYGALLVGEGQIWIDSADVQIVGNDVPTTGGYNTHIRKL